jgi:hypothetical protein
MFEALYFQNELCYCALCGPSRLHFCCVLSYSEKVNQDAVLKVTQAVFEDNGGQDKCPWSSAQLKG